MYKHRSTLECQYCDEKFAFQSELEIHLTVHDEEPSFYCKSCTRSFMRVGDLKEHEESHTGNVHYCTVKGCDFSAPLNLLMYKSRINIQFNSIQCSSTVIFWSLDVEEQLHLDLRNLILRTSTIPRHRCDDVKCIDSF